MVHINLFQKKPHKITDSKSEPGTIKSYLRAQRLHSLLTFTSPLLSQVSTLNRQEKIIL